MIRVHRARSGEGLAFSVGLALLGLFFAASVVGAAVETRIVGGKPAQAGQWPWMVALVEREEADDYKGFACGGSLIAEKWVLTAAHCVEYREEFGMLVDVALGKVDLQASDGERIPVAQIITHPKYGALYHDGDIALLRLERAATLNNGQFATIIPSGDPAGLAAPGANATILGWGMTVPSDERIMSKGLQQAIVTIVSQERLKEQYSPDWEVTDGMLGTDGAHPDGTGSDACPGDSGGPLLTPDETGTRWVLAGVTSWGGVCHEYGYAAVYARVSLYADWINATIVDRDGDGAPDSEDQAPDDATQAAVGVGTRAVTIQTLGGETLSGVAAANPDDPLVVQAGKPADQQFPYGLIMFTAKLKPGASQATVKLVFPASLPENSRIYKTTASGFVDVTGKAEIGATVVSRDTVSLTLTDGDPVDDADSAPGVIADPLGVATPKPASDPTLPPVSTGRGNSADGGSGGCQLGGAAAPGVEWALLVLGALLARRGGRWRR